MLTMKRIVLICGLISLVSADEFTIAISDRHAAGQIRNYYSMHKDYLQGLGKVVISYFRGNGIMYITTDGGFDGIGFQTQSNCDEVYANWSKYENLVKNDENAKYQLKKAVADTDSLGWLNTPNGYGWMEYPAKTLTIGCRGYEKVFTWDQLKNYVNSL